MTRIFLAIGLLTLSGCAAKKPVEAFSPVEFLIAPACQTADARLIHCSNPTDPRSCKQAVLVYSKGCEKVSLK